MFDWLEVTLHSLPTVHHHTPLVRRFCHMHCVVPISQVAPEGLQLVHLQGGEETWSQTRLNRDRTVARCCISTHMSQPCACCWQCPPVQHEGGYRVGRKDESLAQCLQLIQLVVDILFVQGDKVFTFQREAQESMAAQMQPMKRIQLGRLFGWVGLLV